MDDTIQYESHFVEPTRMRVVCKKDNCPRIDSDASCNKNSYPTTVLLNKLLSVIYLRVYKLKNIYYNFKYIKQTLIL